jgi:hypothetical protein
MREQIRVAADVACALHSVAVGLASGALIDAFDVNHAAVGVRGFFERMHRHEAARQFPVAVAMAGHHGDARPIDLQVLARGWQLSNANSLKLARFKDIFPAPPPTAMPREPIVVSEIT